MTDKERIRLLEAAILDLLQRVQRLEDADEVRRAAKSVDLLMGRIVVG
jgi:hypothetical protein